MEKTSQKIEKSNQILWIVSNEQSSNSVVHPRSYTCTFCNRGFSNAQALGGHMNIHRKDRAKLRESAEETILSLEIASTTPEEKDVIILGTSDDKSCSPKQASQTSLIEEYDGDSKTGNIIDDVGQVNQVGLRDESSSNLNTGSNMNQSFDHNSSRVELDLELRLGPEPDKKTSPRSIK